jgi:hypothetical protein
VTSETPGLVVPREPAPGDCGECGASALARYPVLSEGGWFMVVKCQVCLASAERTPWRPLGYVDRSSGLPP